MSSDTLLNYLVLYGLWVVGAVVFLTAMGAPLPSTFFVIACGAFVQQNILEPVSSLIVAWICVVLGDFASYAIGYWLGQHLPAKIQSSTSWKNGEAYFNKRGGMAIFMTRWLITPIALPVNLLAGSSRIPAIRFVGFSASGELLWLVLYGGLGYGFGTQWEALSDLVSSLSGVVVGIVLVMGGAYWLLKGKKGKSTR
ncbi:MAG TPA: VTT domain-containing protein [Anaerolineales bacterium]|nr:VTT domain-containing protein [Anaerolineales bacterium]